MPVMKEVGKSIPDTVNQATEKLIMSRLIFMDIAGSVKVNGGEPKSSLNHVFNFKLVYFFFVESVLDVIHTHAHI
jgi:hypothetical protein